jgi:hypothetical protein
VDDLHVDGKLAAMVVDNQDTNGATAGLEGVLETRPQVGLFNDRQGLLNVTSLGHGNDSAILHIENTVLLEDGALHGLDNNAGSRVGDAGALLVQLFGEEVDTKVAVLASGSRRADADDLARAALEHQDIPEADVVAWNGNCATCVSSWVLSAGGSAAGAASADSLGDIDLVFTLGVEDPVSHLVQAVAERVIVAFLVVVTHLGLGLLVLRGWLLESSSFDDVVDYSWGSGGSATLLGKLDGLVNNGALGVGGESCLRLYGGINDRRVGVVGLLRFEGGGLYSSVDAGPLAGAAEVRLGRSGKSWKSRNVDGGVGAFLVLWLGTGAVLTLDEVDGSVVVLVAAVDLNVGFGVSLARSALLVVVLFADAGTAVTFFFTRYTDLFFAEALLFSTMRKFGVDSERRVLTFPSG